MVACIRLGLGMKTAAVWGSFLSAVPTSAVGARSMEVLQ